jgi:hypothetical protein
VFSIEIDARVVIARLNSMPAKLRSALLKRTYALAEKLKSKVQQKLTNQILKIRTGKLSRSIFQQVTNTTNEVADRVYSSGVPCARIQELGGQTKAHIIEAVNCKALAFNWKGKNVFFARVNHPGSKIPAHHYMGQAFDAMKPEITSGYTGAVAEGTK